MCKFCVHFKLSLNKGLKRLEMYHTKTIGILSANSGSISECLFERDQVERVLSNVRFEWILGQMTMGQRNKKWRSSRCKSCIETTDPQPWTDWHGLRRKWSGQRGSTYLHDSFGVASAAQCYILTWSDSDFWSWTQCMYVVPNVHPWNISYWRINDVFKTGYSHIKNYLPKSTY